MKHIKNILCYLSLFLIVTLCSCKDTKIARDMNGTWKRSYVTSYEDGTKSHIDEQISFHYDAIDKEKDGGTFVEICTGQEEADEDEINAKYRWVSKIEGIWKIELGTLYQHYNLSTLEVEIGEDDVDLKIKDEAWLWNDWGELLTAGLYAKHTIHENLKKETYKELFRSYKRLNNQDNQDIGYSNVNINGNVLSYETGDIGIVKLYRVKERKAQERKHNIEETIMECDVNNNKEPSTLDANPGRVSHATDFTYSLSGNIGKYQITMILDIDDVGNVSGYYYYDSQGPENPINLTGQYSQTNSNFSLLTLHGNNQDVFEGSIKGENYSGEFNNEKGSVLDFNLQIIAM